MYIPSGHLLAAMDRRVLTILLHLLACSAMGQDQQVLVQAVESECTLIRSRCGSQQLAQRDVPDARSTEGAAAEACIEEQGISYLHVTWYGETGRNEIEYFLRNDTLLFALDHRLSYERPIYWDSTRAAAFNDTIVFDPARTDEEQDRYYFKNGSLALWIDHSGVQQDLKQGTNALVGQGLIAHAALARSWFKP
jgi:hypothetical protein